MFLGGDARAAEAMASQAVSAASRVYSMPPAHGRFAGGAGAVFSSLTQSVGSGAGSNLPTDKWPATRFL